MTTVNNKIARFKHYSYQSFRAVEDARGFFRIIEKIGENNWKLYEFKSKPEVLQEYQLLTSEEMELNPFFQGYTLRYVPIRKHSDAKSPEEKVEIRLEQDTHLAGLTDQGYQFTDLEPGEWYQLEIPLKVFDYVKSEDLRRIEFEAKKKCIRNQENINILSKSA